MCDTTRPIYIRDYWLGSRRTYIDYSGCRPFVSMVYDSSKWERKQIDFGRRVVRLEQNTFRSLMKIQGEDGGQLVLGLVDFNLSVRPSCQTDQPILPNYHLPELNLPDSGISKIKVNPTQVADHQLHFVLPPLLFRFRCDTRYIIGQHSLSFMCRRRRLQTCKLRTPDNMASKTAVSLILLGTSALLLDGGKLLL